MNARNLAEEIIARIKRIESLRFDTDVAVVLGAEKRHIGPWKARGQIPWERLLEYARQSGISLDYLVLGRGPVRVAGNGVGEERAEYDHGGIDKRLMARIIEMVDEVSAERGIEVNSKRKAQFVSLLYRSCHQSNRKAPGRVEIEELIDLSIDDA